jgi:hypothetical protein
LTKNLEEAELDTWLETAAPAARELGPGVRVRVLEAVAVGPPGGGYTLRWLGLEGVVCYGSASHGSALPGAYSLPGYWVVDLGDGRRKAFVPRMLEVFD